MGTNYYLEITPSPEKILEICRLAINSNISSLLDLVTDLAEDHRFHVGKQSAGWKFTWNHHNWKYFNSEESHKQWLQSGKIVNEYGDQFTYEEFVNKIDPYNGLDYDSYRKTDEGRRFQERFDNEYFGLRFSTSIHFS